MGKRHLGFLVPAHLFQDISEEKILARLIRLATNRPALTFAGSFEMVLFDVHRRDQVEGISVMDIKPACPAKHGLGFGETLLLTINPPGLDRGGAMPPVVFPESFDQPKGFSPFPFPRRISDSKVIRRHVRIFEARFFENFECALRVVSGIFQVGQIEGGDPIAGLIG